MLHAPQQKRSEQTLKRILTVCGELVDQGRFEQASMQEIARDAGVSVGTLYKRFSSKSAIVEYLVERLQVEQYEEIIAELAACDSLQLEDRVRFLSDLLHQNIHQYAGLLRTVVLTHLLGQSPISETTNSRSGSLIETVAGWLNESRDSPGMERCRHAVASTAFSYQYSVVYPTPEVLLGTETHRKLVCEMALNYLGVSK